MLSLAIESAQALLLPERVPTPLDLLADTIGATLGALLVVALRLTARASRSGASRSGLPYT